MAENIAVRAVILRQNPKTEKKEVLIVQRPRWSKQQPGRESLPGGKQEQGETGITAIKRELKEELGLQSDFNESRFLEIGQYQNGDWVTVAYLLQLVRNDEVTFIFDDNDQDSISWLEIGDNDSVVTEFYDPKSNELIYKKTIAFDHPQIIADALKRMRGES